MRDTRERPVCHRAEDLVTYLYGEVSANDALDFRTHLQQCDACRSEFSVFNQVHDSIRVWRNEALGAAFDPVAITEPAIEATQFVRHERKMSALAALREFFTVSPLWLRGATAFAALLLLALGVIFLRAPRKPGEVANTGEEKIYSQRELQDQINKAVEKTKSDLAAQQNFSQAVVTTANDRHKASKQTQVAVNQPKVRPRGLNRQEREQLAADLRLTLPADEDDLLIALPEQDNPNR